MLVQKLFHPIVLLSIEMYRSFKPDTEVICEILSKVNTYFTHLVPLWYEMITKTLYPWIDLIDHLVSNHGYRQGFPQKNLKIQSQINWGEYGSQNGSRRHKRKIIGGVDFRLTFASCLFSFLANADFYLLFLK